MIIAALVAFAIAAVLGAVVLRSVLRGVPTPKGTAMLHGVFAATGLVLLIIYAIMRAPRPIVPLVLITLAAIGGFVLFRRDIEGRPLPRFVAVGHALLALIGVTLLVVFVTSL